jgi:hypothetical protein
MALILAVGLGLPAWRRWDAEERQAAAEILQAEARARASVARGGLLRDSLAARQQRFIGLAPLLLRGDTPAMGAATLASLVAAAATESSVRLGPVQIRPDTMARGVFGRVDVRAEITGDVRGVMAFLRALERGPTLIAVRELSISQPEPAAAPERAEALHVEVDVQALMLAPRRASKSGANAAQSARSRQ